MGATSLRSRRLFLVGSTVLVCTGCGSIPFVASSKTLALSPQQTLEEYFSYLSTNRYSDAERLMTAAYRERLGQNGVAALLHSVRSARISDVVDAVDWANRLGARLPPPPADRSTAPDTTYR